MHYIQRINLKTNFNLGFVYQPLSSRGQGSSPFKALTRVRIPLGAFTHKNDYAPLEHKQKTIPVTLGAWTRRKFKSPPENQHINL